MPFSTLPDAARLWIYAADRPLTSPEQQALRERLERFLSNWTSHGRPVEGAAEVRDGRFVLLAAHLPAGGDVSGCGIDASVHVLSEAAEAMGLAWLPALHVFYRNEAGAVESASRLAFKQKAEAGDVDAATPVFDVGLDTLAALRAGRFEQPAAESWHADAFPLAAPALRASS